MKWKRVAGFGLACLLVAAVCHAEMTVWFQNGESVRAFKVVFQGANADIYLMDGSVRRVPTNQIDLKSSGILKPEGTYGGKGPGPGHLPVVTPPMPVDQAARQAQLKDEWDRSDKKAIAQKDFGVIKSGDVVRIVGQTEEQQQQPISPNSPYYQPPPPPRDDAFVILFKKPDGTYDKKLLDAVTFASYFKLEEKPKPAVTLPMEPRIPGSTPEGREPAGEVKPSSQVKPAPQQKKAEPAAQEMPVPEARHETRSMLPVVYVVAGLIVIAVAVGILLSRKRQKVFVDTSKFKQYEEELRDFEIEIWLKHGRTMDQLLDISIKKFYGDQPGPMAVIAKMLKGLDKNALVTFISRQSGLDTAASERIYFEMKQRMEWIRGTIDSVAKRTGRAPIAEAAPAPTGIIPAPKPASAPAPKPAAPAPPVPPAAPVQSPKPAPVAAPKSPAPSAAQPPVRPPRPPSEIPDYLNNVLRNLALLSTPPEEE